ncbi:hypothetical protein HRbin19_01618 [bacterium HR19]|nr:hypothetical protein HRbin19_01618 [bacterium HR19]
MIIDGYRLKLITSLGFDISDIPSPVESSTAHHDLYGWSKEAKKPYLYIGKIVLSGVKNIKGRFVDKAGKPIPNVYISITGSRRGIWILSGSDGTFSASINAFKGGVLQFYALYWPWSYSKNIEVGDQNEINLGDIVIEGIPPQIVSVKGPTSIEKGKTAEFEVSFIGGESPSVKWFRWNYYEEGGAEIGNTEKISYTLKKSSYICVEVRDKSGGDSRCTSVIVITEPPEIKVFLSDGTELKEKTEYEFDEKTYVPLKISISDPDSPKEELNFSIRSDYPLALSYIYSLSPVLYTGSVKQDGTFSLIFNAWDSDWNFVEKEIKIKVKNKPITPSISIFPDKVSGNAPLNVSFRVQAKDHIGYVSFDFDGDGKEDLRLYSDYVQKTFDKEGNYTVRAKVVSEDGIPAESSVNIYVFPEFKITQFSASVTQGKRPLRVNFTVQTITNASKYVWFFGDGSGAETYQNTISYTYNPRLAGTYYARVIAVSQYGTERSSNYIPITVLNSPPTIQSFSASSTSGYAPLSITFSVSATDDAGITKYKWVFGDGYVVETTTSSISHQYSSGTFTATVTAYDTDGDTDTKSLQIQVLTQPSCDTPSVSLSANPSSGNLPLTVTFTANVSTQFTISEYSWDFNGDNVIDITTSSPTTSYTYIKSYTTTVTAKVTVVNSCGGSASASTPITITVPQKHSADFFTPVSSCVFTSASIINDASFRVSDLNGDGFQDVAVIDVSTGYLHIATGSGDGTYSYSLSLQVCSSSSPCFTFDIADFDNDGKNDVLVFDDSITSLVFFKNSVSGFSSGVSSFVSAVSDPNGVIHCSSFDIRSADLNGDGKKDVFVGCSGYSFYAFGNGNGSFSGGTTLGFNGWVRRAKISDINGDGKPDIVGLDRDNKNIFFALGNAFGVSATLTLPGGITIESFDIADFDLDSKKDIIAISSDQILYLFRNGGGTSFSFSSTANALIASPANSYLLESAEMNKDGVPDILWTAYTSSPQGLTYFDLSFQNGTTEIAFSDSYPKNTSSYFSNVDNAGPISYSPFAVVDVNNDTFDDVVMVYNNGCVVSFKRKTTVPAPQIKLGEGKISDTANKSHSLVGCSSFTAQTTYIIFLYMLLRFLFRKRKARLR